MALYHIISYHIISYHIISYHIKASYTLRKKVQKPSLGLYLFKRENFCPF